MAEAEDEAEALKPWEEAALDAIRWHWGEAYEIEVQGGQWRARRRDGIGGQLEAANPDGLDWAITEDYAVKPVPRDAGTPG
jgi:hypothetical protein